MTAYYVEYRKKGKKIYACKAVCEDSYVMMDFIYSLSLDEYEFRIFKHVELKRMRAILGADQRKTEIESNGSKP